MSVVLFEALIWLLLTVRILQQFSFKYEMNDSENSNVLSTQYFDITQSDEELRRYLATLEPHTIVAGVTWGDVDSKCF